MHSITKVTSGLSTSPSLKRTPNKFAFMKSTYLSIGSEWGKVGIRGGEEGESENEQLRPRFSSFFTLRRVEETYVLTAVIASLGEMETFLFKLLFKTVTQHFSYRLSCP